MTIYDRGGFYEKNIFVLCCGNVYKFGCQKNAGDVTVEEFHPDIILLGPQVKFKFEETASKYEPKGIPVAVIDLEDYGKVDGERILKRAIKILKEKAVKEDV